ncbi:hypothetical protein [Bacteroides bouchesdurhonensis]
MKGLIVKWGDNVCKAGIVNCGVGLMVNVTRYDGAYWSLSGLRMPGEIHVTWNVGLLEVGDELRVEFAELDEVTPPVVEESHKTLLDAVSVQMDDDSLNMWERKLDTYYRLKKILEDENLIEKE